eukprot:Gb_04075 [translate_table: standard]
MGKIHVALLLLLVSAVISTVLCEASSQEEDSTIFVDLMGRRHEHGHKHRHSGLRIEECPSACAYRCSKTSHRKPCMFFCQKCCSKCRCVPPGTYGHKEVCPCYNNWKTKEGGPKCP